MKATERLFECAGLPAWKRWKIVSLRTLNKKQFEFRQKWNQLRFHFSSRLLDT